MYIWIGLGVLLALIARVGYSHYAEHGSVLRVLPGTCLDCGAMTMGVHVLCNCGAVSPHIFGMTAVVDVPMWRHQHRQLRRSCNR